MSGGVPIGCTPYAVQRLERSFWAYDKKDRARHRIPMLRPGKNVIFGQKDLKWVVLQSCECG